MFVAIVVTVIIALGGAGKSSTATPKNFINNAMQFLAGGKLQTAPAVELEDLKPTEETVGDDETILTIFADYACPHCQTFDEAVTDDIDTMLNDGTLSEVRIAPVSYQPTPYAGTAHLTILCIADTDPEKTYKAHTELMKIGAEGGTDFTTLMKRVGEATGGELKTETKLCVKNSTYLNYANQQNEAARDGGFWPLTTEGITGTPTVFINEQRYTANPDPEILKTAINWVKAGGTLTDLDADPTLVENLDMSDPANPTIKEASEEN